MKIKLHGMLEVSIFDTIDNMSPIFGAHVNSLCDNFVKAVATNALTEYVHIMNFHFKRHMLFECSKVSIQNLKSCNCFFK